MPSPKERLRELIDAAMAKPEFQPKDGVTYCNLGLIQIAENYDISVFRGMMANQICDYLEKNWRRIGGDAANKLANAGFICIAAQKGKVHGHVALVYPGAMVYSTKWGHDTPVVGNVGKRNGVMGANFAFATEPDFFTQHQDDRAV